MFRPCISGLLDCQAAKPSGRWISTVLNRMPKSQTRPKAPKGKREKITFSLEDKEILIALYLAMKEQRQHRTFSAIEQKRMDDLGLLIRDETGALSAKDKTSLQRVRGTSMRQSDWLFLQNERINSPKFYDPQARAEADLDLRRVAALKRLSNSKKYGWEESKHAYARKYYRAQLLWLQQQGIQRREQGLPNPGVLDSFLFGEGLRSKVYSFHITQMAETCKKEGFEVNEEKETRQAKAMENMPNIELTDETLQRIDKAIQQQLLEDTKEGNPKIPRKLHKELYDTCTTQLGVALMSVLAAKYQGKPVSQEEPKFLQLIEVGARSVVLKEALANCFSPQDRLAVLCPDAPEIGEAVEVESPHGEQKAVAVVVDRILEEQEGVLKVVVQLSNGDNSYIYMPLETANENMQRGKMREEDFFNDDPHADLIKHRLGGILHFWNSQSPVAVTFDVDVDAPAQILSLVSSVLIQAQTGVDKILGRIISLPRSSVLEMRSFSFYRSQRWSHNSGRRTRTFEQRDQSYKPALISGRRAEGITSTHTTSSRVWLGRAAMTAGTGVCIGLAIADVSGVDPSAWRTYFLAGSEEAFSSPHMTMGWAPSGPVFDFFPFSLLHNKPWQLHVIAVINVALFLAWRVNSLHNFMIKHMMTSFDGTFGGGKLFHTLLTANFSHMHGLHLAFNTLALYSVGPVVVSTVPSFFAVYAGFGILTSTLANLMNGYIVVPNRQAIARATPSLGASGAIFALFAITAHLIPQAQFYFVFLPGVPIEAMQLLNGIAAFESLGVAYSVFASSPLGHSAHLAGIMLGTAFYY
eukprot:g35268.t1